MPTLVVKYKDGSRSCPLREGVPVFIGRAKECDIHLPSPAVSRRHAVVVFKNGICGVKDLGSFNGTLVNGQPVKGAQHLTDADVLQISSFIIRLDASDIGTPMPAPPPAPKKNATVVLPAEANRFLDSQILLPRSMTPPDGVEQLMEGLRDEGMRDPRGGRDTLSYVLGADGGTDADASGFADDESPADKTADMIAPAPLLLSGAESTVEMSFPAEFAKSLAEEARKDVEAIMPAQGASGRLREGCNVFDTDYFRDEPPDGPDTGAGGPSDAEKLIPMHETERAPKLTLEWDEDATNRALEALVADVSQDVAARRKFAEASVAVAAKRAALDDDAVIFPLTDAETAVGEGKEPVPAEAPAEPEPEPEAAVSPDETSSELDVRAIQAAREEPEEREPGDGGPMPFDTVSFAPSDAPGIPAAEGGGGEGELFIGKAAIPGVEPVVIAPPLMAAINARLALYPLLLDLAEDRRHFREERPNLSPEVAAELDRQDAELDSLPTAEEAERMLAALAARRALVAEAAEHARADGLPLPEVGSDDLKNAEAMAESQWLLVRDSNRETLPAVYKEAYKLAADEPLARDFAAARINHGRLFGGGVYLLALEVIAETAESERRDMAEQRRRLADKGIEKDSGGFLGRLGRIGDTVNKMRNRAEINEMNEWLDGQDAENAVVADRARREFAFMEKSLNREFRLVFMQAAAQFGSRDDMPPAVRAFLRHGVIGFKPWWMRAEMRDYIRRDCRENIVQTVEAGPGATIVLYADEYLGAVANMECSPFPDENPAGQDPNSAEWKTERAFRRIVSARSYNILMDDMLTRLDGRLQEFEDKSVDIERQIAELRDWSSADNSDELFRLQTEQQVLAIRHENMEKHIKRIEKEVVASILEAVEESEGRFRRGELRMPDAAALAAKEGESLALMAKRIGGAQQRFAPLAIRELASPSGLNDRKSVASRLADVEKWDPGVFVNTIIPAKKKENRVELRLSPVAVIFPCTGLRGVFATPRDGMEGGHLVLPMCFTKKDIAEAVYAGLLADFRWETSRLLGGQDVLNSETLAGAFMRFRRDWRDEPQARREKGFIYNELTDKRNWRRVYAAYLSDASNLTRRLPARNPDLYEAVIAPYLR